MAERRLRAGRPPVRMGRIPAREPRLPALPCRRLRRREEGTPPGADRQEQRVLRETGEAAEASCRRPRHRSQDAGARFRASGRDGDFGSRLRDDPPEFSGQAECRSGVCRHADRYGAEYFAEPPATRRARRARGERTGRVRPPAGTAAAAAPRAARAVARALRRCGACRRACLASPLLEQGAARLGRRRAGEHRTCGRDRDHRPHGGAFGRFRKGARRAGGEREVERLPLHGIRHSEGADPLHFLRADPGAGARGCDGRLYGRGRIPAGHDDDLRKRAADDPADGRHGRDRYGGHAADRAVRAADPVPVPESLTG